MPYITDDLDKQGQKASPQAQGAQPQNQQPQDPSTGSNAGGAFAGDGSGAGSTAGQGTGGSGQSFTNIQDYLKANPTGAQKLQGYVGDQAGKIKGYYDDYENAAKGYQSQLDNYEGSNKNTSDNINNLYSEYAAYNPYAQSGNQFASPIHARYQVDPTNPASGNYQNDYNAVQNSVNYPSMPGAFSYTSKIPADVQKMDFSTPEKTEQTAHTYYANNGIAMTPGAGVLQDQFDLSDPGLAAQKDNFVRQSGIYNTLLDPNSSFGYNPPGSGSASPNQEGVRALNERYAQDQSASDANKAALDKFNTSKTNFENAASGKNYDIFGRDAGNVSADQRYSLNDLMNMSYNTSARDQNYNMAGDPAAQLGAYQNLRQALLKANGFGG